VDPNKTSVRALLASLGLMATAVPACGDKSSNNVMSPGANTEGDSGILGIPFGNGPSCGDNCPPQSVVDAATDGDASQAGDASAPSPEAGEPSDASSVTDALALCCACGNAACCDPGCPTSGH
jgi:hypothetical protein